MDPSGGEESRNMTKGFLIDIDGTLLNGKKVNFDAVEFIDKLNSENLSYLLMTNSIGSSRAISQKLLDAGLRVHDSKILNPISSINAYIERARFRRCFVVGTDQEKSQIQAQIVYENPDLVVLLDFEKPNVGYDLLQVVVQYSEAQIPVVSASGSIFYLKDGVRFIDTGSFVALIENITGNSIEIFGKPSMNFFASAIEILGCKAQEILVVGDDWSTDIIGGTAALTKTALVRSGKYYENDETKCNPTIVVDRLMEIWARASNKTLNIDSENSSAAS